MKYVISLLTTLSVTIASHAELITVYDSHIEVSNNGVNIEQHPTIDDHTCYGFDLLGDYIYTYGPCLDGGMRKFSILSYDGSSSTDLMASWGNNHHIGYGLFYFEFEVDLDAYDPELGEYEISIGTGWALVNNTIGTGLSLVQSEITYDVIPEPSSVALIFVGGGIFYIRRKKISQPAIGG